MEFNTKPIIIEMNKALTKGLNDLLANHLERYNLLEQTHEGIMDLPSVRKHLSLCQINEAESKVNPIVPDENKMNAESDIVNLVRKELAKFVAEEINELKLMIQQMSQQNTPSGVVALEKENIKLEIEDTIISVAEAEEEKEEEEEEEEEEEDEEEEEEEVKEDEVEVDEDENEVSVEKVEVTPNIKVIKMAAITEDEVETEEEEEEEEEEFFEIEIDNISYYTNNEDNGFIYEVGKDEELGKKVGHLKDGEPFFN